MSKVLVLGYFGYQTNQLDGQTVKTRDVYRLAKEQLNDCMVDYFDTQELKRNKLLVFKMFWKVMCCNTLFYLPKAITSSITSLMSSPAARIS